MIRTWLSFSVSGLVLAAGIYTACVQSENFARAAELHELQLDSEWYLRRATQLRAELEGERFESSAPEALLDRDTPGGGELEQASVGARPAGVSTP